MTTLKNALHKLSHTSLLGTRKYWWLQSTFHSTFVNTGTVEKVWHMIYCSGHVLMHCMGVLWGCGLHRPTGCWTWWLLCFLASQSQNWKSVAISISVHLFKVIVKFLTLLFCIMWWQESLHPLPKVEICAVHSFDAVGEKNRRYRYFGST